MKRLPGRFTPRESQVQSLSHPPFPSNTGRNRSTTCSRRGRLRPAARAGIRTDKRCGEPASAGAAAPGLVWLFRQFQNDDPNQLPQLLSDHPANGARIGPLERRFRDDRRCSPNSIRIRDRRLRSMSPRANPSSSFLPRQARTGEGGPSRGSGRACRSPGRGFFRGGHHIAWSLSLQIEELDLDPRPVLSDHEGRVLESWPL